MQAEGYKTCRRCGETKALGEFHRDRHRRDGHISVCKLCRLPRDPWEPYPATAQDRALSVRAPEALRDIFLDAAARRGMTRARALRAAMLAFTEEQPPPCQLPLPTDDAFGHWLAGFIDGEGCFRISRNGRDALKCDFTISIREDDGAILREAQTYTGLGRIDRAFKHWTGPVTTRPQYRWLIARKAECLRLIEFLDRYPLRAKKARDYATWREAVLLWSAMQPGSAPNDWRRMAELREKLIGDRAYHAASSA